MPILRYSQLAVHLPPNITKNVFDERKWNVIINNRVIDYGLIKWKLGMGNESTLKIYYEEVTQGKKFFIVGIKGSSLLLKARTNSIGVNDRT